ncbi:MAG TPA: alpha/beta hydrolase [Trichocoleus sp.]
MNNQQNHSIEIRTISANGMTFRCRVCGLENSGDPVILLHGFPETSHTWEGVMRSLAAKGYRCLAPDQRGYSPGARPEAIESYRIDQIASDVVALADAIGFQKFHLVGHDWGSGCGWTVVQLYADRVQSWTALSIPHMAAFKEARDKDFEQKLRSWYIDLFQLPTMPETLLGWVMSGNQAVLWQGSSAPEIADYLTVFQSFEGRQAALNWYRANRELPVQYGNVFLPTMLLWGNQDPAIARAGVTGTKQYMKGEYALLELNAGHRLVQEAFDRVNQEISNHIQRHPIHG